MSVRPLLLVVLALVSVVVVLGADADVAHGAAIFQGTGGAETTSGPPTQPPSGSPLKAFLEAATATLLDVMVLAALILAIFLLAYRIIPRLVDLAIYPPFQLVVEELVNSSGRDDIAKSLAGFSQLSREELSKQLRMVRFEMDRNGKGGDPQSQHVRRRAPLDESVTRNVNNTFSDLLDSLQGVAPEKVNWIFSLMKIAFPSRGIVVSGDLQRRDDTPNRVGITFSVSDMDDRPNTRIHTIWQVLRGELKDAISEVVTETSTESSKDASEDASDAKSSESSKEASKTESDSKSNGELKEDSRESSDGKTSETSKEESKETTKVAETSKNTTTTKDATKETTKETPGTVLDKTSNKETSDNKSSEESKETSKDISDNKASETHTESSKETSKETQTSKETSTSDRDLTRGYIQLVGAGCRWVACEISKRRELAEVRGTRVKESAIRGSIHNFFGLLYTTSAPDFEGQPHFFYLLAVDQYKRAIDEFARAPRQVEWNESHLPYENLANTYSYLGELASDDVYRADLPLSSAEYQRESLLLYEEALTRLRAWLQNIDDEDQSSAAGTARERNRKINSVARGIEVNMAASKLLTYDPSYVQEDIAEIEEIVLAWDTADERNPLSLYGLACWYALAHEVGAGVADARESAYRYLAYSLGRDRSRDLWNWADRDPDLESIRRGGFVERLKLELVRELLKQPDLAEMPGAPFASIMERVVDAASA